MFVQIQTIDGQLFGSDPVEMLDTGLDVQGWDQLLSDVDGLLQDWRNMDYLGLEIGGRKKYFNPANILWAEMVL